MEIRSKYVRHSRGHNDLDQNSVSFMHMFNVYLNCAQVLNTPSNIVVAEIRTVLQSVTDVRAYVRKDKDKTICSSPLRGGSNKKEKLLQKLKIFQHK